MPGPQQFKGLVTAAHRMPKTITVRVSRNKVHPVVGKIQKRGTKIATHDPEQRANVGDTVVIQNCRPISASKRHILLDILQRAKVVGGITQGVDASETVTTIAEVEQLEQQAQEADAAKVQPTA